MKIIHITFSLLNAGKENMLVDIANEQYREGHEIAIVVINKNIDQVLVQRIENGIKFYSLQRVSSSKSLFPFIKLFTILRWKFKADVIHAHDHSLGKLINRLCKIPVVLTAHGPGLTTGPLKNFKHVFAISNAIKQDIESRSDIRCKVVYNGIQAAAIRQRKAGISSSEFKIIQVKRLTHERKGQDLLIQAAHQLVHDKGYTQFKFYLVGSGDSETFLKNMVKELNLNEHVLFYGNKDRKWIYDELANYDLFVHPSRYEGFGLTVAEAMAAKVPIVASAIEGPAEILQNGKFGLMFENNNVDDLAKQIEQTFFMYRVNYINKLVDDAYNHCSANFDIQITAKNYCDSYLKSNT